MPFGRSGRAPFPQTHNCFTSAIPASRLRARRYRASTRAVVAPKRTRRSLPPLPCSRTDLVSRSTSVTSRQPLGQAGTGVVVHADQSLVAQLQNELSLQASRICRVSVSLMSGMSFWPASGNGTLLIGEHCISSSSASQRKNCWSDLC